MTEFENPPASAIRQLLLQSKHIAVLGLSPKANRPSHQVSAAMQGFGYHIIPVRHAVAEVLGEPAYADLYQVPPPIDLVNVFRAPEYVDSIVSTCIELQIPALWLQDGVVDTAAALRARNAGITVIMDRCIYRDYLSYVR